MPSVCAKQKQVDRITTRFKLWRDNAGDTVPQPMQCNATPAHLEHQQLIAGRRHQRHVRNEAGKGVGGEEGLQVEDPGGGQLGIRRGLRLQPAWL